MSEHLSKGLELVIFPCNQFGSQEPDPNDKIANFASKKGFKGTIIKRGDVNGANASKTFKFLKKKTNKSTISWNFDGKFVIDRNGNVLDVSGSAADIEDHILNLLQERNDL